MKNRLPTDWLREDLLLRKQKNASYSLRAFARDLHVSQSILSFIFNGKRKMTLNLAERICLHLALTQVEKQMFLESVVKECSRNPKVV